jgi:hypothetical protein
MYHCKLKIFTLCCVILAFFSGCSKTVNIASEWTEIYQFSLDSYLNIDTALNEDIEFIAIDFNSLEFANETDKKNILNWISENHAPVIDSDLQGLEEKELFDGKIIPDGVFLKILDVSVRENEIIITGMKYRGARAANWFETRWQQIGGIWKFVGTEMPMIS